MKYIYIDTSHYRHLFSSAEGFSEDIFELLRLLLEREKAKLLLPQQTRDEVGRNRLRIWPEGELKKRNPKIEDLKKKLAQLKDFEGFGGSGALREEIEREIITAQEERRAEAERLYAIFAGESSEPNRKLRALFENAEHIEESEEIVQHARLRYEKGNPPCGRNLGDALIWESLLTYLEKKHGGADLIFVGRDSTAWGDDEFDRWLITEYENRVGGKIFYSRKISDIHGFTAEEQEIVQREAEMDRAKQIEALKEKLKRAEAEEEKRNAIVDFIGSPNFHEAGVRARRLLAYKDQLTTEDYKAIIRGSLSNPQIYGSFFTADPLTELIAGDSGYVRKELEGIDTEQWRKFVERFSIARKRQVDSEEINPYDIPF